VGRAFHNTFSCIVRRFQLGVVFLVLPVVGCSTATVFTSYTSKINPLIDGVKSHQFDHALEVLNKYRESNDKILYLLERGRIAQIKNDINTSMVDYEAAIDAVRDMEEKAIISASDVGAQTASILTNENAIPYKGDGYEKVFMYQFQALNYLAKKDIEGAGVEVRRANLEQNLALERYEKELANAEEKEKEKHLDTLQANDKLNTTYGVMDEIAGRVKNSFQNAYTFYMSGIVYELLYELDNKLDTLNQAYIDYKKAIEIFPENTYLQRDAIRLAKDLGMDQDYDVYTSRFGKDLVKDEKSTDNIKTGELVVFFENGLVPQKKEIRVPIPTPNGIIAIAFPIYDTKWSAAEPLSISESGNMYGNTEPICYVHALAVKSLKEKVTAMVIRHLLRLAAKAALQKESKDQLGTMGQLISSFYNIVSERADLRSWLTLPNDVQIMRIHLPIGVHHMNLVHKSSGASSNIDISINQNKKTILRVTRIGSVFYTESNAF